MGIDRKKLLDVLKKAAICAAAAILLAVLFEWRQVATQPRAAIVTCETDDTRTALDLSKTSALVACSYENGKVVVNDGPAQIDYVLDSAKTMDAVIVDMGKAEETYIVRVLYAMPDEGFDLERSVQVVNSTIEPVAYVDIPKGDFDKLAIQIAGNVTVQSIEYAENAVFGKALETPRMVFPRMLLCAAILFVALCALTAVHFWKRVIEVPGRIKKWVRAFNRDSVKSIAVFLGAFAAGYLLARLMVKVDLQREINWVLNLGYIVVGICVGCLFCFRKTLKDKPEVFFVILVIAIGTLMSFFFPDTTRISWDDGYHYQSAVQNSYLGELRLTDQDQNGFVIGAYQEYDLNKWDQWHAEQDSAYQNGNITVDKSELGLNQLWGFVQGCGLYVGRALRLPYWLVWSMGRFFGLLGYAIISYFAIRRLKSGKMMLITVLLIPEAIFLASQYSYDPGIISLFALSMSYLFAEWQEMDQKLTWKNACFIVIPLFLGCMIKGIYFPMFLIPLFLPKVKFKTEKQRRLFFICSLSAMAAVIISFVLPFFSGSGGGDVRGGEDVNAFGQIAYILHNPLQYAKTLVLFLRYYMSTENTLNLLGHFAYMDKIPYIFYYFALMAVVAFTDKNAHDIGLSNRVWMRLISLLILYGTLCLVATALYVVFTPVGLDTVNGCQPRYMIPIIFPAMMLLGSGKIINGMNRTLYNGIVFSIIGFIGFAGVFVRCLSLYTI